MIWDIIALATLGAFAVILLYVMCKQLGWRGALFVIVFTAVGVAAVARLAARTAPRPDTNAILVVPCEHSIPVVIFTHRDGSFTSITPGAPPSEELISRIKRTKRSQINLSCTKETLR